MISGFATADKQLADGHNVVVTSAPTTTVTGSVTVNTIDISTLAKSDDLPDFGTAGTPSPNVITVQGRSSMTPLEVTVDSLDTTPATFNTITTHTVTTGSDTNWHTLPDIGGKEVQIQSASTNTSNILLSKDGAETIGIELLPSTSIAFPINNTNLIEYKLSEAAVQIIYLTVLSNV